MCGQAENVTIFRVHWWVEFAEESRLAKWFYHFFQEWRKECDDMFKRGAILMGAIFWKTAGRKIIDFWGRNEVENRPFGVLGQWNCVNVVVSAVLMLELKEFDCKSSSSFDHEFLRPNLNICNFSHRRWRSVRKWPSKNSNSLRFFGMCGPFGCFLKWWYPQSIPKWSFLVGFPCLLGTTFF